MSLARKIVIITLFSLSILLIVVSFGLFLTVTIDAVPDKNKLPIGRSETVFLDHEGNVIQQEDYAKIEEIPKHVQNAFIAVEDKRFYKHHGIDAKRLIGAMAQNIKNGSPSQGGSTITCQLVKNTHLSNEKTLERKLKEAKIALALEKEFSKEEILEYYLNVIYFGNGVYGIKSASKTYFNKNVEELTVKEGASLAAVIANPARYSPLKKASNETRTDLILGLMKQQGYLSKEEYKKARMSNIVLNYNCFHNNCSNIYVKMALLELKKLPDLPKTKNPMRVYTYLDKDAQEAAKKAIKCYQTVYPTQCDVEFIAANNDAYAVTTYLSTRGSTPVKRQPGSLLKPFIYATAIEQGLLIPGSPILDQETDFNGYRPQNYGKVHYGWVDAKFALSQSLNVPAVSVLRSVGIDNAVDRIKRSGIPLCDRDENLALALGGTTYGSTLPELCKGYLTLSNGGVFGDLAFIQRIEDDNGRLLYLHTPKRSMVFSKSSAYLTTAMLFECAQSGTGKQLSYLPYQIAAKTGTVSVKNGNSDAWCAAYTAKQTLICRHSARSTPLPNECTGGNLPTKTIRKVLRDLCKYDPPMDFQQPFGIKKITIDKNVKNEFHKLVPYRSGAFSESEEVLATPSFVFESIDAERLYFGDLSIRPTASGATIDLQKATGLTYAAYLNGKPCKECECGFIATRTAFPLAKLELICKKEDKVLYKKTKILRFPYNFTISSAAKASLINVS